MKHNKINRNRLFVSFINFLYEKLNKKKIKRK